MVFVHDPTHTRSQTPSIFAFILFYFPRFSVLKLFQISQSPIWIIVFYYILKLFHLFFSSLNHFNSTFFIIQPFEHYCIYIFFYIFFLNRKKPFSWYSIRIKDFENIVAFISLNCFTFFITQPFQFHIFHHLTISIL